MPHETRCEIRLTATTQRNAPLTWIFTYTHTPLLDEVVNLEAQNEALTAALASPVIATVLSI